MPITFNSRCNLLFVFLLGVSSSLTSCSKKGAKPATVTPTDTTAVKWKGDNLSDFRAEGLSVSPLGSGLLPRVPYNERKVGMAYTTWCRSGFWNTANVWALPSLGKYNSDDTVVIRKHAEWLADAGVDFIWIDWSNDLGYQPTIDGVLTDIVRPDFAMIERSTLFIFDVYSKLRAQGIATPNISIFIGNPGQASAVSDGRLTRKADQVYNWFVNNPAHPEYNALLQQYNGKPLLVCYSGTPTPVQNGSPTWSENRFAVRFMTGFVTNQPNLFDAGTKQSKYNYWSWEERGPQTYSVDNGYPEAMMVVPSWRPQGNPGDAGYEPAGQRRNGITFREQWARARLLGVRFAMVGTWNEWTKGEQLSTEVSKDIEPNTVWGEQYLVLLKSEIKKFKGIH